MRRATTADSSRSARNFGKMRPFETASSSWPARPTRCRPARDRLRRLDLDHEVDRAHVDAELERRGGDEARDLALLQQLLDLDALLARQRAVVGTRDLFLGQVVEPQRKPFGEAAVVDEDDRRAVRADELEDLRVDRRPDRLLLLGLAHVVERHDHLQVELLRAPRVDELDLAPARDEAADLLERPLRGRQADALDRLAGQPVEPLQAERQVRAALGARDGVHLVDDHRLDPAQRLARLRGQQQEERLGRRDQDVGRVAHHRGALLLRRVAGADADAQLRAQAGERPAQVALDVVVERLQRRDVEEAQPLARARVEPVDPVEEGRQRLARAGRRLDQRVPAARDRRPAELLRRRRPLERLLEPGARGRAEDVERAHLRKGSSRTRVRV